MTWCSNYTTKRGRITQRSLLWNAYSRHDIFEFSNTQLRKTISLLRVIWLNSFPFFFILSKIFSAFSIGQLTNRWYGVWFIRRPTIDSGMLLCLRLWFLSFFFFSNAAKVSFLRKASAHYRFRSRVYLDHLQLKS